MTDEEKISAMLEAYFSKQKLAVSDRTELKFPDDEEINKVLGNMVRRDEADLYINEQALSYKRRLYYLSKAATESDGEINIITRVDVS